MFARSLMFVIGFAVIWFAFPYAYPPPTAAERGAWVVRHCESVCGNEWLKQCATCDGSRSVEVTYRVKAGGACCCCSEG